MKNLLLSLTALFIFTSCAVSTYVIKESELLPYKESAQITKNTQQLQAFSLVNIRDKRNRLPIGKAYTGAKYSVTPIHLNTDLSQYLTGYFENAFEMRNLKVDKTTEKASPLKMEIEVNHLWVEEVIEKFKPERAKCRVDMSFYLTGENKKWAGNFWTEFTSGGDLSDGTERLAPTLASCMNALVEKVMADDKFITILK